MKILYNLPEKNASAHRKLMEDGWVPLKEPKQMVSAILWSIPFMIVAVLISIGSLHVFSTVSLSEFGVTAGSFSMTIKFSTVFEIALLLLLHEFLHLLFIPHFIRSDKTAIGLTWSGGFVITEEELARSRYLLITMAPFLVISFIVPLLGGALGWLTPLLKFFILLNAMGSSVDWLNFFLVIKQVPKTAVLKSNGPNTYWKKTR